MASLVFTPVTDWWMDRRQEEGGEWRDRREESGGRREESVRVTGDPSLGGQAYQGCQWAG